MKKLNFLSVLLLSVVFTCFITSCATDSSDKESTETETTTESTETATTEVSSPELDPGPAVANMPKTSVEWKKKEHDFGKIDKGEKQVYVFEFTNTGKHPLVIASATAGCGCTVPKKPEEPIQPGKTGKLEVQYNGSGKGQISKDVTVVLNTDEGVEKLKIKANVIDNSTEEIVEPEDHAGHDH